MTERRALFEQGDGANPQHTAEETRAMFAALLGGQGYDAIAPAVGAIARGHGVIGAGSLLVTPNGTPNNLVHIAAGYVAVRGTQENDQGNYLTGNDASKQLTIAASPTNPRRDFVIAQIRDDQYPAFSNDDWIITTVTGTPAGSPIDPAVPEDALVLARLRVPTGVSAVISAAEIDDLRPRVVATGGITPVSALSAWPGPQQGDVLYRRDVDRLAVRTASAWRHKDLNYVATGAEVMNLAAETVKDQAVVFPVTFASAPIVTLTCANATVPAIAVILSGPTTTGFTMRVVPNLGAAVTGTLVIHYHAVGPLAA